jgi:hypothetical protein
MAGGGSFGVADSAALETRRGENSFESRVYASAFENGILSNVPFLIPIARVRNNVYPVVWYSYAR